MDKLEIIYVYVALVFVLTVGLPNLGYLFIRRNWGLALLANILIEIGKYVSLVNTLIHEVFHCIFAWITGGKAHAISLHHDTSGLATTSTKSRFARILVSYAGYTGASIAAVGLFYLLSKNYYDYILYIFIGFLVIGFFLWTKNFVVFLKNSVTSLFRFTVYKRNPNFFGLIWSIGFAVLLTMLLVKGNDTLIMHASMCLSAIVLIESIKTAFVIFILSIKNRKDAGDATSLAKDTFIPALIWGLVFFAQSLYAGNVIVTHYFI